MIGEVPKMRKSLAHLAYATVGVGNAKIQCKAYQQGGKCLDCDLCWRKGVNVNYPKH